MAISQVLIENIIPSSMDVDVQWGSDQVAMDAFVYVALTEADLAIPANRITGSLVGALDTVFRTKVPNIAGGEPPLLPGAQYFCRCEANNGPADLVLSPVAQFMTGAAVPAPPVSAQDVSVQVDTLSPLSLRFSWRGPDTPKGRVLLGTAAGVLTLAGEQFTQGERHTVVVTQNPGVGPLLNNTAYFYKVVSVDASGAALAQSAESRFRTPKAADLTTFLIDPPGGTSFIGPNSVAAGGRRIIAVGTRRGGTAADGHLVEFKLMDPTFGKLGHENLPSGDRVQLISDPREYESCVFISNGKTGTVQVTVKLVGVAAANANRTLNINVT